MSRHLIGANQDIFQHLDEHCVARGLRLRNAKTPRWIGSEKAHRHFMITAVLREKIDFSSFRKLARIDLNNRSFLIAFGFDQSNPISDMVEHDVDPAFLTVALAELLPKPIATLDEIRNIIEFSDKEADKNYVGHDFSLIASLFPNIRIFEVQNFDQATIWNIFFRLCIEECDLGGASWIEGELAATLRTVCDLDPRRIPYKVLCRSVFDGDKSSFFLALYRCLEALYSYSSAKELVIALGMNQSWDEVAVALEDKLGWHPREEGSLSSLLALAVEQDLRSILEAVGESNNQNLQGLPVRAARRIYWARNAIVHYRPAQHSFKADSYDWIKLCTAMAGLVIHVYGSVFSA